MKLSEKYTNSTRAQRDLYRALRGPFGGYPVRDPKDHAIVQPPRGAAHRAMRLGGRAREVAAASAALSYAGKLLRAATRDNAAGRAKDYQHKTEHATRITKAAHALLVGPSK